MARKARLKSKTGIYNILLRAVPSDSFFREPGDYRKFIELLKQNKDECGYILYAYILLESEIRLLLKVGSLEPEIVFKRLCVRYTYWYNCKYMRRGSLFFDRFKSEPVENKDEADDICRYILRLPEKYGINFREYPYSSINSDGTVTEYNGNNPSFFDVDAENEYLTVKSTKIPLTDEKAADIILDITDTQTLEAARLIDYHEKRGYVKDMLEAGIGYRQLGRLLGINYFFAKKAVDENVQVKHRKKKNDFDKKEDVIDFFLL